MQGLKFMSKVCSRVGDKSLVSNDLDKPLETVKDFLVKE